MKDRETRDKERQMEIGREYKVEIKRQEKCHTERNERRLHTGQKKQEKMLPVRWKLKCDQT